MKEINFEKEVKDKMIMVRFTNRDYEWIKDTAEKNKQSMNAVVEKVIAYYIEKVGENNETK